MSMIAEENSKEFDFIWGDYFKGMCIATDRFYFLQELQQECGSSFKVALRDPDNDNWSKWLEFPGKLYDRTFNYGRVGSSGITPALDVHRSILPNEIIVESDYPTYEENYDAATLIGRIIQLKGFIPHYYYSGNKSLHVHVFLDWKCFNDISDVTLDQLRGEFKDSYNMFKKKFIEWIREKMINCWDLNVRQFDSDLVRASHLIRSELSRNKKGYKTFLGYDYKDLSFIPTLCNEENRIYPKIGKIKLSCPNNPQELIDEFLQSIINKRAKKKKNFSLDKWINPDREVIRECVKLLLGDDFKGLGDGTHRAMFILVNELKQVYGEEKAKIILDDWNSSLDKPIADKEINYRLSLKPYTLGCAYVHKFLTEMGLNLPKKC